MFLYLVKEGSWIGYDRKTKNASPIFILFFERTCTYAFQTTFHPCNDPFTRWNKYMLICVFICLCVCFQVWYSTTEMLWAAMRFPSIRPRGLVRPLELKSQLLTSCWLLIMTATSSVMQAGWQTSLSGTFTSRSAFLYITFFNHRLVPTLSKAFMLKWLHIYFCRYPIQVPREGCYGDMDGQPGVRNYGTMNPDHLFDVYCYLEESYGMNITTFF